MAIKKIFAGAKLRELRMRLNITQKEFATKLGISLPYLNQMENNNRPLSSAVMLSLAQEFGFDVTELSSADSERLVSDMREAISDSIFGDAPPPISELRMTASNAPQLARAFLELHRNYRQSQERLAQLDEALGRDDTRLQPSPWEEVRDFFHYCDNYIDAVDRAAEHFSRQMDGPRWAQNHALTVLEKLHINITFCDEPDLRHYDNVTKTLTLSRQMPQETQIFQTLLQVALITQNKLLEATLDLARFQSPQARSIAKIGLANYFAGAALMPYERFMQAALAERHDLERLATQFNASIEQVAHRLSTLQRPNAQGIPFFFVRVDQAGTITKRHSATRLQFARFGGACPLWNVHRAFETPGQFLRQLAETPDGIRYISLARDVTKAGGAFGAPTRRFAIALGCEVKHAKQLVYADTLDLNNPEAFEPIGISCRMCERSKCHQRSVPPFERQLIVNPDQRSVLPYKVR